MRVALFDLDGTITRRDTLFPYVVGLCLRRPHRLLGVIAMLPAVVRFLFDRDRGALKQSLIRLTLRGLTRDDIARWNQRWVPRLLARKVHPEALRQIETHRHAGDYLVLMSASPDLYVPAIARALKMNETICTGVRWNGMRLEGSLTTPNRRGEEKLRCVQALRERFPDTSIVAYGNSASDIVHLAACTRGHLVNASPRAIRKAAEAGVNIGWS